MRIESEVNGIESDIEGMISTVDEIDVTLDDMKTYMNIAKVIVIFIDIIVLSLMLAVVFAWMEKQHFLPLIVRNAFIIPIFVVLLILFWIFLTLSLMGAMMGSDYCAMPDDSTVDVVMRYKDNFPYSPTSLTPTLRMLTGTWQDCWQKTRTLKVLSQALSPV